MKSDWRIASYVALFVALIGGLVFLVARTQAISAAHYDSLINALRDLKQINADWDVNMLHIRIGQASNYDALEHSLSAITEVQDKFNEESQAYWGQMPEQDAIAYLKPLQDKLNDLLRQKNDAVEQFKSDNATLRNSSRFLPTAIMQLNEAVADDSLLSAADKVKLEKESNRLLAHAMSYIQAPTSELHVRMSETLSRINALTQTKAQTPVPRAVARRRPGGMDALALGRAQRLVEHGATLATHVNTVLAQQEKVDHLLTQIAALPVAKAIDDLADAESEKNRQVVAIVQEYQLWLEIYAGLLVAVLLFFAWRLLANLRALGRTNADLESANHEIRTSQAHLIQSEKMSSLGQMVAGIAHEINTPLAYVKGALSLLSEQWHHFNALATASYDYTRLMRAPDHDKKLLSTQFLVIESTAQVIIEQHASDEVDKLLKEGIQSVAQISDIVTNLRNFSRLDREKVSDFSVVQGLDSTLTLARNLLKDTVEVHKDYNRVPNISGSPAQINQVFLNLITNAVHAMPAPGERPGPNTITLRTDMADDDTVRISIRDNGKGIPKDVLPKIFDPFFTTKPVGQGTGLGLSISHKIVEEHGGRILVHTEKGKGTTFTILLPVSQAQGSTNTAIAANKSAAAARTRKPASAKSTGKENDLFSQTTIFSDD